MYRAYARDARARINLGIRRRLAPLMQNNRRKMELINVLLLSFPGTPILYYGDELGMDVRERRHRMRAIRTILRRYDIYWWVNAFLEGAFSTHLEDFPPCEANWAGLDATQGPPWDVSPGK